MRDVRYEKPWMHQASRDPVALQNVGAKAAQSSFHRDRSCPVGEFLPIGIGLSASVKADGQHYSVGTRRVESHAIVMPERRAWQNDIGIHPARVELPVAGFDAQQDKGYWIPGVVDGLIGEERFLTHGQRGLVTGND